MGSRSTRAERRAEQGSQRRPASLGSRLLTLAGVLCILGGLGMLGYVGWEFYGTTWLSKKQQAAVVQDLEQAWSQPATDGSGKAVAVEGTGVEADAIIRIPRFGADYAVPVLDGIGDKALSAGFGRFEESAGPGEKGNYALAGHRITHGEPLRRMPELRVGDRVVVETRSHVHTYEMTTAGDDLRVSFKDGWVLDPLPENPTAGGVQPPQTPGQRLITLTTCAELFHTDERMIAFGVLVESAEKL